MPTVSSIAVLLNVNNPQSKVELKEMQTAAQAMGLQLHPIEISKEDGLDDAFAAINKTAVHALIVLTDPILFSQRKRAVELANKSRLPAVYFFQGFVEEGGLISYGPDIVDQYRRAPSYVDRIFEGEKPADLPVQAPTKYELVINLKTAKALGLNVPQHANRALGPVE